MSLRINIALQYVVISNIKHREHHEYLQGNSYKPLPAAFTFPCLFLAWDELGNWYMVFIDLDG